jgi:hypothetical protein
MAPNDGESFDKGLKPVVAAELQGLEKGWQHAPVVACKLPLHDGLAEQTQPRSANVKLGHEISEDLLFDSRKDHLAYDPVWVLDHDLGNLGQNLHLALDTLEVSEQLPVDLLLRAYVQAVDEFNSHPRHVVCYLQSAYMQKAPHERIPNALWVLAHLAGLFVGSTPFEHLQHLPGNFGKWFCLEADGANSLELANFAPKIIDAWFAGICLQFLKAGDDARFGHEQQIVHADAHIRRNCRGDAPVNVLKKSA